VLFCQICDYNENRAAHQFKISYETEKKTEGKEEAVYALEDTHFNEHAKSKNEQIASESNDFLLQETLLMVQDFYIC
jgi:hypothetical protein